MLALITAALEGLASLKFFFQEFKALSLASRLEKIEQKQQKSDQAFMKLAAAKTDQEYDDALSQIASSINS